MKKRGKRWGNRLWRDEELGESSFGATPVRRLGLQKLPCPARTAVHFLAEPPQKIDEKMSAFKNELGRLALADQESDQSGGGSSVGVWNALRTIENEGRPKSCVSR